MCVILIYENQFEGEPVSAAFGAEGQQSDQVGGTGEGIMHNRKFLTFGASQYR